MTAVLVAIAYLTVAALCFDVLVRGQSPLQRSALRLVAIGWLPVLAGLLVLLVWERGRAAWRRP